MFVPFLDDDIGFARAFGAGADELDDAWVCCGNGTGFMGGIAGVSFGLVIFRCGSLTVVCCPVRVMCRFVSVATSANCCSCLRCCCLSTASACVPVGVPLADCCNSWCCARFNARQTV